jgi:hypothetical protein
VKLLSYMDMRCVRSAHTSEGAADASIFEIGAGETKEAPDWVREDTTFQWAHQRGRVVVVDPAEDPRMIGRELFFGMPAAEQFEALESIKEVLNRGPKIVRASTFRELVAREHGTTSDRLTRKQIRFSAGAFAHKYGHVKVVPDDASARGPEEERVTPEASHQTRETAETEPQAPETTRHEELMMRLRATGRKFRIKDISTVAGYDDPSTYERYRRGSSRVTATAKQNFDRVLSYTAAEFFEILDSKQPK